MSWNAPKILFLMTFDSNMTFSTSTFFGIFIILYWLLRLVILRTDCSIARRDSTILAFRMGPAVNRHGLCAID